MSDQKKNYYEPAESNNYVLSRFSFLAPLS